MSDFDGVISVIREAADSDLPAFQRRDRLHAIRDELAVMINTVEQEIAEATEQGQAEDAMRALAVTALRERASISEALLAEGDVTAADLAEAGVLNHYELDALEEEGLLEATAQELLDSGKIDAATGEWVADEVPAE